MTVVADTKYDFEQLTPQGDFKDKTGRWWRVGISAGCYPVTPPLTPLDWDVYVKEMDVVADAFTRQAIRTLTLMANLSQRLGPGGPTAPEIADTLREWVGDVLDGCRAKPEAVSR